MMKKFLSLFNQDLKIITRSGFHYALIALAIVFIAITNFALPESLDLAPEQLFYDGTEGRVFEQLVSETGLQDDRYYTDYSQFKKQLQDSAVEVGIAATGTFPHIQFEIISKTELGEKTLNTIKSALQLLTDTMANRDTGKDISFTYLREQTDPMPFNLSLVPIFITFEVVMLGFILIAVLIFQEKEEGSIRAYRVSAGKATEYILSKSLIIALMGLVYGIITTLLTVGPQLNYLILSAIILLAGLLMTFLGLGLSVFFKNISEFLVVSVAVMLVIQLPLVSYFNPSFSPWFIRLLPSYPVLFGIREIIYPTGKTGYLGPLILILALETIVVYIGCYLAVRLVLMKVGKKS